MDPAATIAWMGALAAILDRSPGAADRLACWLVAYQMHRQGCWLDLAGPPGPPDGQCLS